MTVQSARVQSFVQGDDVTLNHQVMQDIAYNAEVSRAPVLLNTGDTVNFFYADQDSTQADLLGYPGVPTTAYPCSTFNVVIPGVIPAVGLTPQRGTSMFRIAYAQTVRAEVTRVGGKKTTYYLLEEIDVLGRGFPTSIEENELELP
jgi:hypothetical protein